NYSGYWLLDRDDFMPRYDWEPGNEEATRKKIDNIYIALSGSCGHKKKVAENPMFRGLDDARVSTRLGCTFCENWINVTEPWRETPLKWVTKQVHGIAKSRTASGNFPNGLLFERVDNVKIFQKCIDAMEETGMVDHVGLLFAARTNMMPKIERILKKYLAKHPREGVRFGVYASGIESFSGPELLRFNKGTKPLDCFKAINILKDLSMNYPDRFEYTGLTFILFTPWTTPETLLLNIGLIRFFELTFKGTSIFQSRLRLHPNVSITSLAERDGLTIEEETDPLLVMNRRKLFNNEIPWRFADPRLKPLSRLVLRCEFLGGDMADNLTMRIEECLKRYDARWRTGDDSKLIDFIYAMIDVARNVPEPIAEEILLERGLELLKRRREEKEAPPGKRRHRIGTKRMELAELLKKLDPLLKSGVKPLLSIENVTPDEVASGEVESLMRDMGIRTVFQRNLRFGKRYASGVLFCGNDEERLGRLVAAHEAMLDAENEKDMSAAIIETGNLYGYPECCIRAFAAKKFSYAGTDRWTVFAKRNEISGEIPQALNPLLVPALMFVPCRPDCREAGRVYSSWFDVLKPFSDMDFGEDLA
ncbi:MAG: hypothetical protein FJ088_10435, partial [Deltaproteobacteria bacterium]|nr:hypothetical protein [Deltaproteobacteria bacterium]